MKKCTHDWSIPGSELKPVFVIDDWQGPTDAIVRCQACGAYVLIRLLHWSGRNLATRIYALASLDDDAVHIFLRNMKSAYCDLSRHGAETDMLIATATGIDGGVILQVPELRVRSRLEAAELGDRKIVSWRSEAPDETDSHWLAILSNHGIGGLSKPSSHA